MERANQRRSPARPLLKLSLTGEPCAYASDGKADVVKAGRQIRDHVILHSAGSPGDFIHIQIWHRGMISRLRVSSCNSERTPLPAVGGTPIVFLAEGEVTVAGFVVHAEKISSNDHVATDP